MTIIIVGRLQISPGTLARHAANTVTSHRSVFDIVVRGCMNACADRHSSISSCCPFLKNVRL